MSFFKLLGSGSTPLSTDFVEVLVNHKWLGHQVQSICDTLKKIIAVYALCWIFSTIRKINVNPNSSSRLSVPPKKPEHLENAPDCPDGSHSALTTSPPERACQMSRGNGRIPGDYGASYLVIADVPTAFSDQLMGDIRATLKRFRSRVNSRHSRRDSAGGPPGTPRERREPRLHLIRGTRWTPEIVLSDNKTTRELTLG